MITKIFLKLKSMPNQSILFALIAADLMFAIIHIIHKVPSEIWVLLPDRAYSISEDRGLAEAFQYVQELWVTLAFLWLVYRYRRFAFVGFSLLFAFFLVDDMTSIHENLGALSGKMFSNLQILQSFSNLRPDDFGELFISAMFGIGLFSIIGLCYWRTDQPTRQIFHQVLGLLAVFIFFGVGIDFLDRFASARILQELLKLLEDGGEMLAMSLICWYAYLLCDKPAFPN